MSGINSTQYAIGNAYDRKLRPLIDIIDDLRKIGLQNDIKLPNVVVVGDQSSGKSSIIEALSGVELPRGTGMVTRCPLELQLVRSPKGSIWKGTLTYRNFSIELKKSEEIGREIRKAQDIICGNEKNVSEELVTLRIESSLSATPDLTLIDLPGIARIAVQGQEKNVCEKIKTLIETYVKNKRTLILCVISSDLDLAVNEALSVAAKYDPNKERTIGVLTKPDRTDKHQKEDIIKLLSNERFILNKGYRVVKCRSQDDLDENITLLEALRKEREFFNNEPCFRYLDQSLFGIMNLANKITEELKIIIEETLPILKNDIKELIDKTQIDLDKLPLSVPFDPRDKKMHLVKIIHEVLDEMRIFLKEGKGNSSTNFFKTWREYFEIFREDLNKKQADAMKIRFSLENLSTQILNSRGRELNGFMNYQIFEEVASCHVKTFERPANILLESIKRSTETYLNLIIDSKFKHLPEINKEIKIIVLDCLRIANTQAQNHIKFIFEEEQLIFTMDNVFQSQKDFYSFDLTYHQDNNNSKTTQTLLECYFKIVINRLCDILPMTIRQWLHIKLFENLYEKCLNYPNIENNENKVEENQSIQSQRQILSEKYHRLISGKKSLENFSC